MKTSHTLVVLVLLTIGSVSIGLQGCKKGADDPLISLHSRKARVVGDWRIANLTSTTSTVETATNGTQTTTEIQQVSEAGFTTLKTAISGVSPEQHTYDEETTYSFAKDGTWKSTKTVANNFVDTIVIGFNNNFYQQTTLTTTVTESNGTWNFLAGIGDAKNKENVIVETIAANETANIVRSFIPITNGAPAQTNITNTVITSNEYINSNVIWQLTSLKNKTLSASIKGNDTYYRTINGNQSGTKTETTFESTLKLEAK